MTKRNLDVEWVRITQLAEELSLLDLDNNEDGWDDANRLSLELDSVLRAFMACSDEFSEELKESISLKGASVLNAMDKTIRSGSLVRPALMDKISGMNKVQKGISAYKKV